MPIIMRIHIGKINSTGIFYCIRSPIMLYSKHQLPLLYETRLKRAETALLTAR